MSVYTREEKTQVDRSSTSNSIPILKWHSLKSVRRGYTVVGGRGHVSVRYIINKSVTKPKRAIYHTLSGCIRYRPSTAGSPVAE